MEIKSLQINKLRVNKSGFTLMWDKIVTILLSLIVLFFLLALIYFVYKQMVSTEIPGLI